MNNYTIISAYYASADGSAIVLRTVEHGDVMVTERDRPELWQQFLDSGVIPEAMPQEPITDPQAPVIVHDGS